MTYNLGDLEVEPFIALRVSDDGDTSRLLGERLGLRQEALPLAF